MLQAYFNGKLVIQDNRVKHNEDLKTSSSIGLLQYLPDYVFWEIMKDCCVGLNTEDFGEIERFNFWPHTERTKTNAHYVEPDVWIETTNFDIIIEAKISDDPKRNSNNVTQWTNEIESLKKVQKNNGYEKPIILIALSGNESMQNEEVLKCPVYKASWYSLLNSVVKVHDAYGSNGYISRILNDVVEMFACQGLMKIKWLNLLPYVAIDGSLLALWERIKTEKDFSTMPAISINNNYILLWNPVS